MKLSYFKLPNCWHFIYAFNLFLRSGGASPPCACLRQHYFLCRMRLFVTILGENTG
jgi:hypothetical protein